MEKDKPEPTAVRLLTWNLWGVPTNAASRTDWLARQAPKLQTFHALAFQEVVSAAVQQTLANTVGKTHTLFFSQHTKPSLPLVAWLPSVGCLILLLACAWWTHHFAIGTLSWGLLVGAGVLLFAAMCASSPLGLLFLVGRCCFPRGSTSKLDLMGLALALDRRTWKNVCLVDTVAFSPPGYRCQPDCRRWASWWLSHSFLRPGFMVAQAQHVDSKQSCLFINCHLVNGTNQQARETQIQQMLHFLRCQFPYLADMPVYWLGDFNAPKTEHGLARLFESGFHHQAEKPTSSSLVTWSTLNPYTRTIHPEQIDHVFVRCSCDRNHMCTQWIDFDQPPLVSDHYALAAEVALCACEN